MTYRTATNAEREKQQHTRLHLQDERRMKTTRKKEEQTKNDDMNQLMLISKPKARDVRHVLTDKAGQALMTALVLSSQSYSPKQLWVWVQ